MSHNNLDSGRWITELIIMAPKHGHENIERSIWKMMLAEGPASRGMAVQHRLVVLVENHHLRLYPRLRHVALPHRLARTAAQYPHHSTHRAHWQGVASLIAGERNSGMFIVGACLLSFCATRSNQSQHGCQGDAAHQLGGMLYANVLTSR